MSRRNHFTSELVSLFSLFVMFYLVVSDSSRNDFHSNGDVFTPFSTLILGTLSATLTLAQLHQDFGPSHQRRQESLLPTHHTRELFQPWNPGGYQAEQQILQFTQSALPYVAAGATAGILASDGPDFSLLQLNLFICSIIFVGLSIALHPIVVRNLISPAINLTKMNSSSIRDALLNRVRGNSNVFLRAEQFNELVPLDRQIVEQGTLHALLHSIRYLRPLESGIYNGERVMVPADFFDRTEITISTTEPVITDMLDQYKELCQPARPKEATFTAEDAAIIERLSVFNEVIERLDTTLRNNRKYILDAVELIIQHELMSVETPDIEPDLESQIRTALEEIHLSSTNDAFSLSSICLPELMSIQTTEGFRALVERLFAESLENHTDNYIHDDLFSMRRTDDPADVNNLRTFMLTKCGGRLAIHNKDALVFPATFSLTDYTYFHALLDRYQSQVDPVKSATKTA